MCIYVMSIYRLTTAQRTEHADKIGQTIDGRLAARGADPTVKSANILTHYKSWATDRWWNAFCAFVDMYMTKFPHHPIAEVKISTLSARFKDCTALQDLVYITRIMGVDLSELALWLWDPSVATDFMRILTPGEEIDVVDSYTPYMTELHMSSRSPYSTTINPHFHYWVHVVGCSMNSKRSQWARIVGSVNVGQITTLGAICGYAFTARTAAALQFSETGEEDPDVGLGVDAAELQGLPALPSNLRAREWYGWYEDIDQALPEFMTKKIEDVWRKLDITRENTVGKHLNGTRLNWGTIRR